MQRIEPIPTPAPGPPPVAAPPPARALALAPLSTRDVDRVGSFLDRASLSSLTCCNKRTRWIFQARMRMLYYLEFPLIRDREIGPSIGMAIVYAKDGQPRLIKIVELHPAAKYAAVTLDTQRTIGTITVNWWKSIKFSAEIPYENGAEAIEVVDLAGCTDISGVGKTLMQAGAMEFGLNDGRNCELRVFLQAAYKSHTFYWGLGMRIAYGIPRLCQIMNMAIAKAFATLRQQKKREPDDECLSCYYMHLPADQASKWQLRIRQDPILYKTRARLAPPTAVGKK